MSSQEKPGKVKKTPAARKAPAKTPPAKGKGFPVVGMGASAGGLEALEQFFSNLPPDSGMAFVIVPHLDPARHSGLPDILNRFTKMPIVEVTEGLKVKPDSVYLIPPNRNMSIRGGTLYLQELAQPSGIRLPIDFFFRSLAQEKGPDAIAIVLSGTGMDGTLGIRAVKAEQGTVVVQEPQSARYDGMPRSALDTGLADFVLPPDKMPEQLIQFVRHIRINGTKKAKVEEAQEPLQKIFATLRSRTGHDFSQYKLSTIQRRIERRMSVNQVEEMAQYARFLKESRQEVRSLLKDILISVTSFFRDPEAFEALGTRLKAYLRERPEGSDLRVWVAGCATGEEAYSVAITILEVLDELEKNLPLQVFASDIDTDALSVARAGRYPANIVADVSEGRLKRFFTREEGFFRVKKELRERVVFAPHNLIKDPPFSRMDLLCCRNLLIYLESDLQKKLVPLIHYALKPGALLFLGPSETVGEFTDLFSVRDKKWKIYQQREAPVTRERIPLFPTRPPLPLEGTGAEPAPGVAEPTIPRLAERVFLENYAPAFAVIDERHRIIYVRGRTGKYLELVSGPPNLSILEMAREGLRSELALVIYRATSERKPITLEGLRVKYNGSSQSVNLTVAPLTQEGVPPGFMMVIFQEVGRAGEETPVRPAKAGKHLQELEQELKGTRENLQNTIEELEAANEELQSANEELQSNNEELQSTNEELDTSREELQSLNEELLTVNAELQAKNEQLARANDDLKNLLNRTDIAIIFLDEGLKIRRYTPAASEVFNLIEADLGRPLSDITTRLAYERVVDDAREVFRTLSPREVEVQRKDGRWYQMRILPYLTVGNMVGGVVMSFLDINEQKLASNKLSALNRELQNTLKALQESGEEYRRIVETAGEGIWLTDTESKTVFVNKRMAEILGYTVEEMAGKLLYDFVDEKDRPVLEAKVRERPKGIAESYDLKLHRKDGSEICTRVSGTPDFQDSRFTGYLGMFTDVTEQKRAEEQLLTYERLATLGKVVGSISHELRNPLGIIDTSAFYLKKRLADADEKVQTHLERIHGAVTHSTAIIQSLLNFSKTREPRLERDDLRDITTRALLDSQMPQGVGVVKDFPAGAVTVKADEELMGIAFRNLLRNAVQAMEEKGKLTVAIRRADKRAEVSFTDTGPGIAPENLGRLFEPLFTTKEAGTGFGLALTKHIVERHGGTIAAQSEPGKGATFTISLPLANQA